MGYVQVRSFFFFFLFESWFPSTPVPLGPFPCRLVCHLSMHTSFACSVLNVPLVPGYSRPSHGPVLQILFPQMRMPFPVFLAAKSLLILLRPCSKSLLQSIPGLPSKQFLLLPSRHITLKIVTITIQVFFKNLFILKTDENDQGPVFNNVLK